MGSCSKVLAALNGRRRYVLVWTPQFEPTQVNDPNALETVSPLLRKGTVEFESKRYEYLLARHWTTDVYLVAVAAVVGSRGKERGFSDAQLAHFIDLYRR